MHTSTHTPLLQQQGDIRNTAPPFKNSDALVCEVEYYTNELQSKQVHAKQLYCLS